MINILVFDPIIIDLPNDLTDIMLFSTLSPKRSSSVRSFLQSKTSTSTLVEAELSPAFSSHF